MKKFSDFAEKDNMLTGDKIKINLVLNKEIEILGYSLTDSKYKEKEKCLKIQFKLDDVERVLFTGSSVLIKQCEQYKDEMPFITTIKQIDKYYTFS